MKLLVSSDIADRLKGEGFKLSPADLVHEVEDSVYQYAFSHWKHLGREKAHTEAAIYCLTHPNHRKVIREGDTGPLVRRDYWTLGWRVLVIILLLFACVRAAHCQRDSQIYTIKVQNQGSTLGTFAAPFVINCSSNMTCSKSGSVFTITSSSTGSTNWSAIVAGTDSNAGTFAVSGNTWDFSLATLLKARFSAGLTTSTNGDFGQDSTTGYWHFWQNGHDRLLMASTNVGNVGQAALSNADGTFTFSDPIVSGPDAPGVAPTKNPVQMGTFDGTNVQRAKSDTSGDLDVVFPSAQHVIVDTAPTTTVSGTVTANQGGAPWSVSQSTAAAGTAGWPMVTGNVAQATASWTSATSSNTALTLTTTNYNTVLLTEVCTSTLTGGVITFEVSDDNFVNITLPIFGTRNVNGGNFDLSFTFGVNSNGWQFNVAGYSQWRARLSTVISGTGTCTLHAQATTAVTASGAVVLLSANQTNTVSAAGSVANATTNATGQVNTSVQTSLTTAVVVKASSGNVYGFIATNGSTTTACYLEFMNVASSPTLGTGAVFSIPIPVSSSTAPANVIAMPTDLAMSNFSTGISVGMATAYNGSTACGTAGQVTIFYH